MKESYIAKVWEVGGAPVVIIPKKLAKLFKIKKGEHYRITIEELKK